MAKKFFVRHRDGIDFFRVLGIGVSALDLPAATKKVLDWVSRDRRAYVTITGMHGIMEAQSDEALARIFNNADMVTPDGMPLVYIGRNRGYAMDRVCGPDLMLRLMEETADGRVRHFLYGGNDGVAELLRSRFLGKFPNLNVCGIHTPPFRPLTEAEKDAVADEINASGADIVWVGISTPKQEFWMADMRPRLQAKVLIAVGAAFDFHSGLKPQAPHWMQRACLEWFFRLCTEPRRLWRRYVYNIPGFIWGVTRESLGFDGNGRPGRQA